MEIKKLDIDIGHGENTYDEMKQTGSKGYKDFEEFDFNNKVAKLAKPLAEHNGFEVYLSQPFDANDVPLDIRTKNIIAQKCDLSFSIHANASTSQTANGHSVYYWSTSIESKKLAELWDKNADSIMGNKDRNTIKSIAGTDTNFAMTRLASYSGIPSILMEHAFFTNDGERTLISTSEFQYKCAKTLVKTACDYFDMEFKEIPVKIEIKSNIKLGYEKIRFDNHTDVHIYRSKTPPNIVFGKRLNQEKLSEVVKQYKGIKTATNCGMFGFDGKSEQYGLLITDNGTNKVVKDYYQNSSPNFVDYICWEDGTVTIERVKDYTIDTKRLCNIQSKAYFGIGTSWSIINNGIKDFTNANDKGFSHSKENHNRTMIGFDSKNKIYYSIVADGRTSWDKGLNINDQYKLGMSLGITHLCNLDGGGSSDLWLDEKGIVTGNYISERPIGTVVAYF